MRVVGKSKRIFRAPKPPAKVYCKNCKFYRENDEWWPHDKQEDPEHQCTHKRHTTVVDTPVRPVNKYGDCNKLNCNNDCPLFMDTTGNKK